MEHGANSRAQNAMRHQNIKKLFNYILCFLNKPFLPCDINIVSFKMKTLLNIFLAAVFTISAFCSNYATAQNNEVPFTQEDRDRLIRLEYQNNTLDNRIISLEKIIISLDKRMISLDKRMISLDKRMITLEVQIGYIQRQLDDIKAFLLWGFGILFGGMGILIGFVLWDRRTTLAPVIKENQAMKRVFLKLAENNTDVKEALKEEGIL